MDDERNIKKGLFFPERDIEKGLFFPFQDINIIPFGEFNLVDPLLSFDLTPASVDDEGGAQDDESNALEGIWSDLEQAIIKVVKADGIRPDSIQEGQTEDQVFEDAVSQIYYDVSEFYDWYFDPEDDRSFFLKTLVSEGNLSNSGSGLGQNDVKDIPSWLTDAVKPVVDDNLDAMREVDEIPEGQDTEGLDDEITDALSKYILNWQDWYYDRKEEEEIDSYFEQKSFYDDIYLDDDYGDLGNLLDDGQFDGVSDVPYIGEEV